MPSSLSTPPPLKPTPKVPRRPVGLSEDQDVRSLQVGAALTVVLWLLLLCLVLISRKYAVVQVVHTSTRPKPVFNIEMAPEEFILPQTPEKPKERFVETNPDAPENTPDKTNNFAAQNQQVAQEVPDKVNHKDMPSTKGKKEGDTSQIVSGSLQKPEEQNPEPVPPPSPEMMQAIKEAQQQREQNPLSGEHKDMGESESGYGFNQGKKAEKYDDVAEKVEGGATAPLIVGAQVASVAKVDPRRPMPRPRLEKHVRPAVLVDRPEGTSNIGSIACDAHWSQYGQYYQQFVNTVQIEWERVLEATKAMPPPGSQATVKFKMDSDGNISEIISAEGNGGEQYTIACKSGITNRAPYGKWTPDMIAVLGESTEFTFTFYIN